MEASLAGGVAARHCLTLLLALLVAAALAGETDAAEVEAALYLKETPTASPMASWTR